VVGGFGVLLQAVRAPLRIVNRVDDVPRSAVALVFPGDELFDGRLAFERLGVDGTRDLLRAPFFVSLFQLQRNAAGKLGKRAGRGGLVVAQSLHRGMERLEYLSLALINQLAAVELQHSVGPWRALCVLPCRVFAI